MTKNRYPSRFGVLANISSQQSLGSSLLGPTQLCFPFIEPVGRVTVVNMETVSYRAFVGFLRGHQPQFLFDLRPFPNFDVGQLSRRSAFEIFNESHITYRDLAGALELAARHDVAVAAAALAEQILEMVEETLLPTRRFALLVDGSQGGRWAKMHLSQLLGPTSWVVHEIEACG